MRVPTRPFGHDLFTLKQARKEVPGLPDFPAGTVIGEVSRIARCIDCARIGRAHRKVFGTGNGRTEKVWRCVDCIVKRRSARLDAKTNEHKLGRAEKTARKNLKRREDWGRRAKKRYRWDVLNYAQIVGHKRKKKNKTLAERLGD